MGYPLFGRTHLFTLACFGILLICAFLFFRRLSDRGQERMIRTIPFFMLALEISKDSFLAVRGFFGIGYLPLHLCSVGIFIFLLRELLPAPLLKEILGNTAFVLILPASLSALLFPDWTTLYPAWNFMSLYSYLWHTLLVLYPLLLWVRREINPSFRTFWQPVLVLLAVTPPVYFFDRHFGCNYFFLLVPLPGTPLQGAAELFGIGFYRLGLALLAGGVMLFMTALSLLGRRIWQ